MKITISRLALVALIGKIQNVVPTKPSVPILANILLEAVDDQLIISATDLTVSMRAYTEAKVVEEGAITLPARRFFQLIRELTAPTVEIHLSSPDVAAINAGSSHFKIHGMHKNEFPTFPDLSDGNHLCMASNVLREMLSKTLFAAARDDHRQVLNGICLQHNQEVATFIGTDGKRLAHVQMQLDSPLEQAGSYIIPLKAVDEMVHILDNKEELAKLTLMQDKIAIEVGPITLIAKLLSGDYPDVSRVIPEKKENPLSLHREELMALLRQVVLFTEDSASPVRFTFTTGQLHLCAANNKIGEGSVNMPVNYGGEKLDIAFNPNFFLDVLKHSKDESVNFNVVDAYNPGLITDSTTAQFVIMPMRLED